ncbi:MAG: hypothetical protein K0R57_6539 [Paenibacillaceae bacterium]|jgi:putative aldouronate transport system substrate-binding protein|nr:hypothetical protein [Paenibacillaceae bacterium]
MKAQRSLSVESKGRPGRKEYLWTAAALALSVMAAAGCSGNGESGTEKATPGAGTQAPEKRGSISMSIYDRGNVPAEEGTIDNNRWTKWMNENGPADIKFVPIPRSESLQKLNVLFASGTAPDLILEFDRSYLSQLYTQKQLLPLDDLIAKHSTEYKKRLEEYPLIKKATTMPDGKMYNLARPYNVDPQHFLYIRADWLKKLNLQAPATPEELQAVARAFTEQDPDGNGKKDTEGIGLSFVSGMVLNHMFGTGFTLNGTDQYPWVVENGKVVHDWERIKGALSFQKQIYDAGYGDKDFVTDKNGQKQFQNWVSGKIGIRGGSMGGTDVKGYETLKKNVPEAEVLVIALPKTSFGQFSPMLNTPVQFTGGINAAAKDPVSVMKVVDFMASPEHEMAITNGIEGVHYKKGANGCAEQLDYDKYRKEVSYALDLNMLSNFAPDGCSSLDKKLNPTAAEKEMGELLVKARELYVTPERPMPGITMKEFLPILPQELDQINSNANKTILDLANKLIVSGGSYTPDQFIQESKAVWEKAGGARVDEYIDKWYQENKDTAILMKDIYQMK